MESCCDFCVPPTASYPSEYVPMLLYISMYPLQPYFFIPYYTVPFYLPTAVIMFHPDIVTKSPPSNVSPVGPQLLRLSVSPSALSPFFLFPKLNSPSSYTSVCII